jgi:hypothetical protein
MFCAGVRAHRSKKPGEWVKRKQNCEYQAAFNSLFGKLRETKLDKFKICTLSSRNNLGRSSTNF